MFEAPDYLRRVELVEERVLDRDAFPFDLPAIRTIDRLRFDAPVTFLVGENGSGKSTILEAIAAIMGLNPEGGNLNTQFETRASHSALHRALRPIRGTTRPRDSFFLRAESVYNLATYIEQVDPTGEVQQYWPKLHDRSHGEGFMDLLLDKLRGRGFYLFDEPEAALSPVRQLAAISAIHHLVQRQSQFVIATHSPILMAYPHSRIFWLDDTGIAPVEYRETEHYRITRACLEKPEKMLTELLKDADDDD